MADRIIDEELIESELYEHFRFVADPGQSFLRIDKFLVNRLENTSRSRIQAASEAGNILVNDIAVRSSYKVKPGDTITIVLPDPPREIELLPENIPLNIVFEDDQLIIVNKKPGMVVHPGYGNYTGTLINALMYHLRDNPLFQSGEQRPGLVHRIDKDTSGLLVIAKTELAMNKLALQFFNKTSKRNYVALVWGNMEEDEGTITGNLGRNPKDRKKMHVFADGSEGKHAVTHYKVLERFDYVNLVECRLETGRTHQIRVHFQYIECPLVGDLKYGIRQTLDTDGQCLHALAIDFIHPTTQEHMHFEAPLPTYLSTLLEKLRMGNAV